ncbi:hypothetical protein PG988_012306 [Apiospora saccharicola]
MSKETFFAAASASCADQGQPHMNLTMRPASYAESSTRVYRPYTTPYTGVGQVVDNQQPMAAIGFKVAEAYNNTSSPSTITTRPVIAQGHYPIHEMPAPVVAQGSTPEFTKPDAPKSEKDEAPSIFMISKIDIIVDRYRTLGLSKEQTLDATHHYPEAKELTDKDLQDHATKLLGRGRSRFCGFRQWSRDTGFADKSVAAKYLIVSDIPKADPGGKKPRDDKPRAARLNAIFEAIFAEAELRQYKTERTGLPTSMDENTVFAAAEFVYYDDSDDSDDSDSSEGSNSNSSDGSELDDKDGSELDDKDGSDSDDSDGSGPDSDDSDNSDSDNSNSDNSDKAKDSKEDISEFIENPDGSVTFNPAYLEFMNSEEARELRAAIKASLLVPADKKDKAEDMPASESEDDLVVVEPLSPVLNKDDDNEFSWFKSGFALGQLFKRCHHDIQAA